MIFIFDSDNILGMENNYELINHSKLKHVKIIVNRIVSCNTHIHNDFELSLVLRGNGIIKVNNTSYNVKQGDLILINTCDSHSYSTLSEESYKSSEEFSESVPVILIVQISNHFLREYYPNLRNTLFKSGSVTDFFSSDEILDLKKLLLKSAIAYFSEEDFYQLQIVSYISKLFQKCYEKIPYHLISEEEKEILKKRNERIQRIISYIDENFTSRIRLEDIAEMEKITTTHVSHIFTDSFGISFQEYINLKRLEESIRLMDNHNKKLIDIAFESGFSDPKYMNKMYQKYFNCRPKEFKTQAKITFENNPQFKSIKDESLYHDKRALEAIKDFIVQKNIDL